MAANDFVVLIPTAGRPNKVLTYKSLRKHGYTGKIFLVVADDDISLGDYRTNYGKEVIVFNKAEIAKTFDSGDNFHDMRVVVYARNALWGIAKELGFKYFVELDDDYTSFAYKFNTNLEYQERGILNLDKIFGAMFKYYKSINALSITMAQNGDFMGGSKSSFAQELKLRRKAMNTFFCSTDRPFQFIGRINEDVNTYVTLGSKGQLFLTVPNISITQTTTQKQKGGMTEVYVDDGTYLKSFYSVMYAPSCVKVAPMGDKHKRLHHRVDWNAAVPLIINEAWRKRSILGAGKIEGKNAV